MSDGWRERGARRAMRNWGDEDVRMKMIKHGELDDMGDDAPGWYADARGQILARTSPERPKVIARFMDMYKSAREAGDEGLMSIYRRHLAELGVTIDQAADSRGGT